MRTLLTELLAAEPQDRPYVIAWWVAKDPSSASVLSTLRWDDTLTEQVEILLQYV